MLPTPLQFAPPGAIELVVVFLASTAVPLVVVALVLYYLRGINEKLSRLVELQQE